MGHCSQATLISDRKVYKIRMYTEPMMREEQYIELHQVLYAQIYKRDAIKSWTVQRSCPVPIVLKESRSSPSLLLISSPTPNPEL